MDSQPSTSFAVLFIPIYQRSPMEFSQWCTSSITRRQMHIIHYLKDSCTCIPIDSIIIRPIKNITALSICISRKIPNYLNHVLVTREEYIISKLE